MVDVVVVALGRPETARSLLDAADCLAKLLSGANIIALAIETPPPANPLMAEALIAEVGDIATAQEQDRQRIAALRVTFDAWASEDRPDDVTAQWSIAAGPSNVAIEQRGRRADLIVIPRPMEDDDEPTRQSFRAALLHTDRPILVVPPGPSAPFGRSVAIAWRDDSRTAKAVIPALRFMARAEQVHLLAGLRRAAISPSVPAIFRDHGIRADLHVLPIDERPLGRTLLEKLHEVGADMFVMGAYAHSRLQEMMFGGVTRYLLEHADVPVLMRH